MTWRRKALGPLASVSSTPSTGARFLLRRGLLLPAVALALTALLLRLALLLLLLLLLGEALLVLLQFLRREEHLLHLPVRAGLRPVGLAVRSEVHLRATAAATTAATAASSLAGLSLGAGLSRNGCGGLGPSSGPSSPSPSSPPSSSMPAGSEGPPGRGREGRGGIVVIGAVLAHGIPKLCTHGPWPGRARTTDMWDREPDVGSRGSLRSMRGLSRDRNRRSLEPSGGPRASQRATLTLAETGGELREFRPPSCTGLTRR